MARGKIVFTLAEKQQIVDEAYSIPENIKKTARVYKIQPNQIRKWKQTLSGITNGLNKKIRATASRTNVDRQDIYEHLLEWFHHLREEGVAVSVSMLCQEARR